MRGGEGSGPGFRGSVCRGGSAILGSPPRVGLVFFSFPSFDFFFLLSPRPPQQTARVKKRVTFLLCVLPACRREKAHPPPTPAPARPGPRLSAGAVGPPLPPPAAPSGRPAPPCPGAPPLAWAGKRRAAGVPAGPPGTVRAARGTASPPTSPQKTLKKKKSLNPRINK